MNPMDSSRNPSPPLRILSLGTSSVFIRDALSNIRGKSSLLILEKMMERIRDERGFSEIPKPCDYFDLIGGTSTRGIIAIMLGRLGMTVNACIEAYDQISQTAFTRKRTLLPILRPKGVFSAKALEAAIKQVARENCTDQVCIAKRDQGNSTIDSCEHGEMLPLRDRTCTKT
ncbi:hypothetical protein PG996_012610 [Apiospora saccharicola]|uniref:PNPLA domain-containing protein n=1 Tax=Apiospora saccharicola TaxID=335842 RepID=A0ABR1U328_9PEZI